MESTSYKKMNRNLVLVIPAMLFIVLFIGQVSAGFASSFIPKVDGKMQVTLDYNDSFDYYIYPQNLNSKTTYFLLSINDKNFVKNSEEIKGFYEVPPYTYSDDFPIKLVIGPPYYAKKGELNLFQYQILSVDEEGKALGFSPFSGKLDEGYEVTYKKSIYLIPTGEKPIYKGVYKKDLKKFIILGLILGGLMFFIRKKK